MRISESVTYIVTPARRHIRHSQKYPADHLHLMITRSGKKRTIIKREAAEVNLLSSAINFRYESTPYAKRNKHTQDKWPPTSMYLRHSANFQIQKYLQCSQSPYGLFTDVGMGEMPTEK